jgi:hypothetical protein
MQVAVFEHEEHNITEECVLPSIHILDGIAPQNDRLGVDILATCAFSLKVELLSRNGRCSCSWCLMYVLYEQ